MNRETASVCNYIQNNRVLLNDYIKSFKEMGTSFDLLSYSGFLLHSHLEGTTEEDVDFSSSKVTRREVSRLIQSLAKEGL